MILFRLNQYRRSNRFLPVTGIPLPFISHGGSSLLTSLAAMVLLNISRQGKLRVSLFSPTYYRILCTVLFAGRGTMAKLIIEGGLQLNGTIRLAAPELGLKLMAASILGHGSFHITDVPAMNVLYHGRGLNPSGCRPHSTAMSCTLPSAVSRAAT